MHNHTCVSEPDRRSDRRCNSQFFHAVIQSASWQLELLKHRVEIVPVPLQGILDEHFLDDAHLRAQPRGRVKRFHRVGAQQGEAEYEALGGRLQFTDVARQSWLSSS